MSWLPGSRSSQPSNTQVEALISFLEERLDVAGGFGKTKVQKDRTHKHWLRIALKLNNMGGAVKTTQRWIKYWNDKKSAVRKKAAIIENSQRNGQGDEEVPELSDLENRILTLMKAVGHVRSNLHLRGLKKEPTEDHQNKNENSNKIQATYLLQEEMGEEDEEQEEKESTETNNDDADDAFLSAYRFKDSSQNHREENSHTPPASTFSSSRWDRLKMPPKREVSSTTQTPPTTQAPTPTTHTNFFLVADRLCRIEQQRLELDRRMVEVLERNSERDFMLVEAVKAMGEGLKALAEAIAKN